MKGLIHRAHLLCDIKEDLLDELDLLRDVFVSNGYPRKLINRTIKDSWKRELEKEMKQLQTEQHGEQQEDNSEYYDTLYAPYIAGFSEKLAKDLRNLNIGVTFQKGSTHLQLILQIKTTKITR